jgi:LuxR family maltose regulon positive regulatory protein
MVITVRDPRVVVPQLPPKYVSRGRLLADLDRAADLPLTLVCAGPGTGKTALLAEWAGHVGARVAWVCPGPGDCDPARFWRLFESALAGATMSGATVPRAARPAPALLPGSALPGSALARSALPESALPGSALAGSALAGGNGAARGQPGGAATYAGRDRAQSLLRRVPDGAVPLVVIIDDAHLLDHPDVLDGLDSLVQARQPGLRLVLAACSDPLLPLHKYRLAGQLFELRAAEVAMTRDEAQAVLAAHGVALPRRDFDVLMTRTEGWTAGVRLSAMRMEGAEDPGSFARQLALDPGSIGEYLVDEVLRWQPEEHRRLLVETSFLDEVTGPLADAVTGIPGSGDILAELARCNSFVIPVDPLHTRFRYHQLFGEVLRYLLQRRAGRTVRRLNQRAAAWFAANDDPGRALYWATQAGDARRVATLLARGGFADAFVRRIDLSGLGLREFAPPPGSLQSTIASHAIEAASVDPDAAEPALERVRAWRREAPPVTDRDLMVTCDLVELVLGQRACDRAAVDAAAGRLLAASAEAAEARPPGLRAAVLLAQASAHLWHGTHEDVGALLDAALAEARRAGQDDLELEALAVTALADAFWSRTNRADQATKRAYALCKRTGLATPPALDLAAALRALVAGDLGRGALILHRIAAPREVSTDPGIAAALALGRAGVLLAQGKEAAARAILHEQASRKIPPVLGVHRDIMLADLDTARGRPRPAVALLEKYQGTEFAVLTASARARALMTQGDPRAARDCVRTVLSTPSAQTGRLTLVEAMLCDARITLQAGAPGHALEIIVRAIEVARGEIKLPFLLTGDSFTALLGRHPDVAARWPLPPRDAAPAVPLVPVPRAPRDLPDPLTPRELTILRFLATSMSAAEIAAELCLSVNTVKTHLAAIYRKLPASRRREAVLRARELELI